MFGDNNLVCIGDFERHAKSILPKNAWDYYCSGAGEEFTLTLNRNAFQRQVILYVTIPNKLVRIGVQDVGTRNMHKINK
jgi:isopentenyl diphosphate isomerase/L-lactate dehydrogenase-like FMN-dependent dehydrogenase